MLKKVCIVNCSAAKQNCTTEITAGGRSEMATIDTTKVRQEWVDKTLGEIETITRFAEILGVPPSTASRWIEPGKDANGRFIGAVLNNFPVNFDDVFVTVREELPAERVRLRRRYAA
ncbi:hypothetical protein CULC22_01971 [Corynebacterium ulcerans BR-AD22]|nr:hypothetical protein CULC22_01971 [Corynebacterium ulcerans BR-AD22]